VTGSLKGLLLLALAGCASSRPAAVPALSPEDPEVKSERQLVREVTEALQQKDLAAARKKLQAVIDAAVFTRLASGEQQALFRLAAAVAAESRRWPDSHALYVRATSLPEPTAEDWIGRTRAAWVTNDNADLAFSIGRLARLAPPTLEVLKDLAVFQALRWRPKTSDQEETRFQLLDALFAARWKPRSTAEPSEAWRDLALLLLERNVPERAVQVAARVVDPHVLVSMRVDYRFAGLVRQSPDRFDIDQAAAHQLERSQAAVSSQPRSLEVLGVYLRALTTGGRYKEVLDLADEAITRASASRVPPYDDVEENLTWIRYARAKAVRRLGRWEQAVEELERARQVPEYGHVNVNQSINLASLYCDLDRPADALAVIAPIGEHDVNEFGRMQLESVRHTAAVERGDAAAAERAMAWLREHHADAEPTFEHALIVANELDQAERMLIERLADPKRRTKALVELQTFASTPATRRMRVWRERWQSVVARPSVRAAAAKVGSVEDFSIAPE
jgi:tetratricopeptide (TPR) repeat protein